MLPSNPSTSTKKQWVAPKVQTNNKQVIEAVPQFGFLKGGNLSPFSVGY